MDIENLLKELKRAERYCLNDYSRMAGQAATALSTLQIENQALRNAANGFKAENEKLRAELERVAACVYYKPGGLCRYDGDDPANVCVLGPCDHEATAKEVINELEQARESLDFARTKDAEIVRLGAELERVKSERDEAIKTAQELGKIISRAWGEED